MDIRTRAVVEEDVARDAGVLISAEQVILSHRTRRFRHHRLQAGGVAGAVLVGKCGRRDGRCRMHREGLTQLIFGKGAGDFDYQPRRCALARQVEWQLRVDQIDAAAAGDSAAAAGAGSNRTACPVFQCIDETRNAGLRIVVAHTHVLGNPGRDVDHLDTVAEHIFQAARQLGRGDHQIRIDLLDFEAADVQAFRQAGAAGGIGHAAVKAEAGNRGRQLDPHQSGGMSVLRQGHALDVPQLVVGIGEVQTQVAG